MAGARKRTYSTFHTGGQGEVGHGGDAGTGPHMPNQVVPGQHKIERCPADEGSYDENFGHKTGSGSED